MGGEYCQFECDTGFLDCDGNQGNGCEVSTTTPAPHEHVVNPGAFDNGGGCGSGGGGGGQVVATIGSCSVECDYGWSDCDHNATNGCETQADSCYPQLDSSKDASADASIPPQLLVTLTGAPRGLAACAGRVFYFDDNQLHAIDESTLTISIVTVSPQYPSRGLACDGAYVYWTTLPDADASTPNGTLMRATVDGTKNEVVATNLDPGQGIDVRPSGPIYFLARSGFGPGPNIVAARMDDAGVSLDTWMPALEQPSLRPFAWSATDDWSMQGGLLFRRPVSADASAPWMPAPNASGLLADDAGLPYAVVHMPLADAGDAAPTDDFVQLDGDAGLVSTGMSLPTIVATTSNADEMIAASDDTVFALSLPQGAFKIVATTTDHVVDVAHDEGWAVWITRGAKTAQIWRAKAP